MHTASNEWSPRSPFPLAPRGTLWGARRLFVFGAVSAALHAVTFGAYHPGAGIEHSPGRAAQPVLHAVLSPREAPPPVAAASAEAAQPSAEPDAPSPPPEPARDAAESGPRGTVPIPLPERWYSASEVDTGAQPLSVVQPDYPAELSGGLAVAATVRLKLYIDERGLVRKMEVAKPGPRPEFDEAALRAWERVRFTPALRSGVAVKSQKLLELDFAPY